MKLLPLFAFISIFIQFCLVTSDSPSSFEFRLNGDELRQAEWPSEQDSNTADDLGAFMSDFFDDSRTQLTLDLDMFRQIYDEINRYRNAATDGKTDVLEAAAEFFAPLREYDVSAPCLADVAHFFYTTYSYASTSVRSRQCETCNCSLGWNAEFAKYRWIFNVLDSMGKIPSAILGGNNLWVGSWNVCRNVAVVKNSQGQQWRGQYCMARFHAYNRNNPVKAFMAEPEDPTAVCYRNGSSVNETWSADDLKCFDLMPLLNVGICTPDTCTDHDVHQLLKFVYNAAELAFGRPLVCDVTVQCSSESPEQNLWHHTSSIVFSLFLLVIFTLLIFGTGYELYVERPLYDHLVKKARERELEREYEGLIVSSNRKPRVYEMSLDDYSDFKRSAFATTLMMFSVSRNLRYIMETKTEDGQIRCLHGARFLSMCWIIFGHTYYYICSSLTTDNLLQTMRDFPKTFYNQLVVQATLAVDSFFFLSGLLTAYIFLGKIRKNQVRLNAWTTWFAYYVRRYLRLTPIYVVVMLMVLTIFPFVSEGPFWRPIQPNNCADSWWTNLLYLNNFLKQDDPFYTFLPLLILALHRLRMGGVFIGIAGCVISSVVTLWITIERGYPPAPLLTTKLQIVTILNDYWVDLYVKPYCRMSPYIIGCLTGYLLLEKHRPIFKLNTVTVIMNPLFLQSLLQAQWFIGWIVAGAIGAYAVFGLFNYTRTGEISPLYSAIYTLVGRPCFALFLAWVVFVCEANPSGNRILGRVNAILGHRVFVPLSKITFCAYLIHPILLQAFYLSRPSAFHFTNSFQMLHMFLIALAGSYAVALLLSLAFELPVMHLDKLIFQPTKRTNRNHESPPTVNGNGVELNDVNSSSRFNDSSSAKRLEDMIENGTPAMDQQNPLLTNDDETVSNGTKNTKKDVSELRKNDETADATA
ncbi:NRF domain-containing protein [Aphelenchoides besseyi]|nr:NRF domain-containing protein [Aphelenchoides besseyi]